MNGTSMYLLLSYDESQGQAIKKPYIWNFFRGIISPLTSIIELSLISYMICHQDKINKSEKSKIKK